jgi:hypothetical protein
MKVKELIKKLQEYPEDMEVIGNSTGGWGQSFSISIYPQELNYCKFSTYWNNAAEELPHKEGPHIFNDYIDGKNVKREVHTEKKIFVILEI